MSLVGFISAVGLIASVNIKKILKDYGIKFLLLGLSITLSGALTTYLFTNLLYNIKADLIGTYVGALTSSPGLATALEIAKMMTINQSASVGLGYSIAYIPGVIVVILFAHYMGKQAVQTPKKEKIKKLNEEEKKFHLTSFMIVVTSGITLGLVEFKISETMTFSLGMTGGVLVCALFLGSSKKIGRLSFEFDTKQLNIIKDISLNMFLAIVGLNYGYEAISAIYVSGVELLAIGLLTGCVSVAVGYYTGKYLLKIEHIYLVGGLFMRG
jgi:putative transport protein